MKLILSLQLVLLIFLVSCTKDKAAIKQVFVPSECDSIAKSFSADVQPIINNNCVGCHSSSNPSAGYNFDNYTDINSNLTIFFKTIKHDIGVVPMPYQQSKLSDSLIQVIDCWIESGAPNN